MEDFRDHITDDEIRVIGGLNCDNRLQDTLYDECTPEPCNLTRACSSSQEEQPEKQSSGCSVVTLIFVIIAATACLFIFAITSKPKLEAKHFACKEHVECIESRDTDVDYCITRERLRPFGREVDRDIGGFCEIKDTIINDIPLKIYIPHNAEMTLQIGRVNPNDTTIVYVAQAADVRADNGGIVGAFVLKGKPMAWGLSKKGYCAAIDGKVFIGVAESTSLFERATERDGYFFRQYPLVSNGTIVENEPKGKSIRRAICDRWGEVFMVESQSLESFHDFSQALVDLGIHNAVYLVGSSAYGWSIDESGEKYEWGEPNTYTGRRSMPKNTSYIIWRKM